MKTPMSGEQPPSDAIPSSSPAFGTPARPFRINKAASAHHANGSVLPVLLPPATLRPIAFRTFTRKHNLTISSSALQTLAVFVGKNCGAGWRKDGLAERVLDEVAKFWKKAGGGVIVEEGKGASLKAIIQDVEASMSGGRIVAGKSATDAQTARALDMSLGNGGGIELNNSGLHSRPAGMQQDDELERSSNPRKWIKVVGAFDMPRLSYNVDKKYFEVSKSSPTLFPPASHKTSLFHDRYNLVYQRLLRNEAFQTSVGVSKPPTLQRSASSFAAQESYKLTPIANLLGRSGTSHLVLGLLSISPAGDLSLVDMTGNVALDLSHARLIPEDGAWFTPGMIVLVDGVYEGEENVRGSTLGGYSGVGGTIGGRFIGVTICGPPCERRDITLGTNSRQSHSDASSSGGFGWVDFLGVGSERAHGQRMRKIRSRCLEADELDGATSSTRLQVAVLSEVHLDNMKVIEALRKVLGIYMELSTAERPLVFILMGNFVQTAIIHGGGGGGGAGSIEYKEHFDTLAGVLSEFPGLLQHSTFIFVPGDRDPWASAFSAGASTTIPRDAIPELFTSRVKRAFASANSARAANEPAGEALWTTNPTRLSLFGPLHEIAIFRDDISERLRRSSVTTSTNEDGYGGPLFNSSNSKPLDDAAIGGSNISIADAASAPLRQSGEGSDERHYALGPNENVVVDTSSIFTPSPAATLKARKLVKTILDQGTMSPFPLSTRPVLWDFASAVQLYPLPTAFVLADAEAAPFCITYEACHVMNPGRLISEGDSSTIQWIEYDVMKNRGRVRQERL